MTDFDMMVVDVTRVQKAVTKLAELTEYLGTGHRCDTDHPGRQLGKMIDVTLHQFAAQNLLPP